VAKVAIARKLAVRMYWMLRSGTAYAQLKSRRHHRRPSLRRWFLQTRDLFI
jgi:hypothetical protein